MELRVKEICKEKGITLVELAEKIDMKQANLSKTLQGNPTLKTLEQIALALNVNITELFVSDEASLTCPKCGTKLCITVK